MKTIIVTWLVLSVGLGAAWDELTALYLEELPTGRCKKLYDRMNEIERGER